VPGLDPVGVIQNNLWTIMSEASKKGYLP
jgi:hypothetical protein